MPDPSALVKHHVTITSTMPGLASTVPPGSDRIDLGRKDADLVVLRGDSATCIADIENVEIVFEDGVGYDTNKLLESVKGRYGEY